VLAPWADVIYGADEAWWTLHIDGVRDISQAKLYTQNQIAANKFNLSWIRSKPGRGLSTDNTLIHQGCNSGYQAINLAYHLGVKKIVLLGFDMQHDGKKMHWFGNHPYGMNNPGSIATWVTLFNSLADDLKEKGVEVVNATGKTALTCFERVRLHDAI